MYQFNLSTKPLVPEYRVHAPTLVSSIFLVVTASAVLDIHSRVATLFRRSITMQFSANKMGFACIRTGTICRPAGRRNAFPKNANI